MRDKWGLGKSLFLKYFMNSNFFLIKCLVFSPFVFCNAGILKIFWFEDMILITLRYLSTYIWIQYIFYISSLKKKIFFHFIFIISLVGSMLLLDKLIKWSQITYFRRQHPFFLTLGGTRFHSNISSKINWFFFYFWAAREVFSLNTFGYIGFF